MKIALLVCNNQYQSKFYFTQKFGEAMQRHGLEIDVFPWTHGPVPSDVLDKVKKWQPSMTFTFNQPGPDENGQYFWDHLQIPNWTFLVDPAFFNRHLIQSPYSIISCVDQYDCLLLHSLNFNRVFFCPHAIEKELEGSSEEKIYDVSFLGTCYDPEGLNDYLKTILSKEDFQLFEEASAIVLSEKNTTFLQATLRCIAMNGLKLSNEQISTIAYCVDSYTRGLDRLQLIRSIKDAKVHVFGGEWWVEGPPKNPWSHYFSSQPNVVIHPSVSYPESLKILRQSKICLNSMPFFKSGSHERIFAGLACGSLILTSRNNYIEGQFVEGQEILFYDFKEMGKVNDLVNHYLANEKLRKQVVEAGRQKVLQHHTWDNRVETMLQQFGVTS